MEFGLVIFPTDQAIPPVELAVAAEARGFESLWFPEHSHIPVSRETPWGGYKGMPTLPEEYKRTLDQFVALGACASATRHLKLGTGITLVAQRDPVWLAKEVASLDYLSNGRVLFGIGYGWNREEMRHHGIAFKDRREILREKVLLMKALWTQEEASFHGKHIKFEKSWAWPKPVQKPHPPIIMGAAAGPKSYSDIVEFCDGWMPVGGLHDFEGGLRGLRQACADAGRDPATIELTLFFSLGFDPESIKAYADAGVKRIVLPLPPKPAAEVLPMLDGYAKYVR